MIAPPPVNAHTHLDMSAYSFRALPYFRWIPEVVVAQSAKRGVAGTGAGADTLARLGVGAVLSAERFTTDRAAIKLAGLLKDKAVSATLASCGGASMKILPTPLPRSF